MRLGEAGMRNPRLVVKVPFLEMMSGTDRI